MQKEIFILEDDKNIGFILNHVLHEAGYLVNVYETIADFRAALVDSVPDLLLMDVRLPDGNGMELCAELRLSEVFQMPVIMMSADLQMHDRTGCGADAYIPKPFDVDDIVAKIGEYLKQPG